jgi:hypothetical protein
MDWTCDNLQNRRIYRYHSLSAEFVIPPIQQDQAHGRIWLNFDPDSCSQPIEVADFYRLLPGITQSGATGQRCDHGDRSFRKDSGRKDQQGAK